MMKTFKYILFVLTIVTFIYCDEKEVYKKSGLLKWTGDYAADGCGFFLEIESKEYKPENEDLISADFRTYDSTSVFVTFEYSEEMINYWCGWTGKQQMDGIKIISIERISIERH